MAKTSKVTELKHMEGTDNYGNYSHIVKFENGDGGFCRTKDPDGKAYAVGVEVEYDIEERMKKDGVSKYFVIKKVRPQQSPYGQAPVAKGRGVKDYKAEAIMIACSNAANVVAIKDGVSETDFPAYFKAFLNPMFKELEQVYAE